MGFYEVVEEKSDTGLKFFFKSKGKQNIIKVIHYSFVQQLSGKNIYNLGFGDYNLMNDTIIDDINANNGDTYKVFNTVLRTIPVFFENFENAILMVQGSDGKPGYIEKCRRICRKNCVQECKNYNRRISIYCGYVDRNYDLLIVDFQFLGGLLNEQHQAEVEVYKNMKTKGRKSKDIVKVPESGLLSLVASKLKDRVLFPKKVEDARKFLQNVKKANS